MELNSVLHLRIDAPNYSSDGIEKGFVANGFDYHAIRWQQCRFNYGLQGLKDLTLAKVKNMQPKPPDLIFLHIQNASVVDLDFIKELAHHSFVVNYTFDVRKNIDWYKLLAPHIGLTLFSNMTDVKTMRDAGFENIDYLQVAVDYDLYNQQVCAAGTPIVFIGNNFLNTNLDFELSQERKDMVDFLYKHFTKDFKAYGLGWNSRIIDNPEEQRSLYGGSKIAISHNQFEYDCYTSDRLFRAMGCGVLCLTKHFQGIETMFEVGKHLVTWRTLDELKIKTDYYLGNEEERQLIADAGMRHVQENHTWTKRIERLKELVYEYATKDKSKV